MREKYETLSVAVLRELAKSHGIKGASTMKKSDLIDALCALEEKMTEEAKAPAEEKPWLNYYSEDVINGSYKELSIYDYLYENNTNYLSQTSLHYLGNDISYGAVFKKIKESAAALQH